MLLPAGFQARAADFALPPKQAPGQRDLSAYRAWYCEDRQRLQRIWESGGWRESAAKEEVLEEWRLLVSALHELYSSAVYEDPVRHYYIYDADTAARIHVLSLAKGAREEMAYFWAERARADRAFSFEYPEWGSLSYIIKDSSGGSFLRLETSALQNGEKAGWIPWEEVRDSLNSLDLPAGLLSGCRIFLLPGEIKGAAGFSVTSFLPSGEEKIFLSGMRSGSSGFSLDAVLAHEVGHCLHYRFMGDYFSYPAPWEEYLRLRDQESFCGEGCWKCLTEENFAEDFKVLFGTLEAQKEGHRGSYGDPLLNPEQAASVKRFMGELMERELGKEKEEAFLNFGRVLVSGGKKEEELVLDRGISQENWLTFSAAVWLQGELKSGPAEGISVGLAVKKGDNMLYSFGLDLEEENGRQIFKRQITFSCPGCYQLLLGALDKERNELTVYKTVDVAYLPW